MSATTGLIEHRRGNRNGGLQRRRHRGDSADLNFPTGIALNSGNSELHSHNNLVREVNANTGLMSTVAGTGTAGYNGDGILATSAELNAPEGLAVDSRREPVYCRRCEPARVREVSASTGLISTVAGTGFAGYNGDGIAAGSADLNYSVGLAIDSANDLFIGDLENNRVREIASGATAVTVTPTTPSVTVSDAGGVFNGNPFVATATVAGAVPGVDNTPGGALENEPLTLTYYAGTTATETPLSGEPTAAGTYTVVASFPGSQDYATASASATFFHFASPAGDLRERCGRSLQRQPVPGIGHDRGDRLPGPTTLRGRVSKGTP